MQSLLIRPAKEVDIQGFLNMARAMGDVSGVWGKDPRRDFYRYLKEMKEDKVTFLLAVVEQNKIIGFSVVKFFKRLDPSGFDPKSCTVGVAVHPEYRRRGVGTKLIEYGLKEAKKRGIETAYTSTGIDNIAMQQLAQKLGFTKYAVLERDGGKFPRYKRKI